MGDAARFLLRQTIRHLGRTLAAFTHAHVGGQRGRVGSGSRRPKYFLALKLCRRRLRGLPGRVLAGGRDGRGFPRRTLGSQRGRRRRRRSRFILLGAF